jgi:hypothetical protein
MLLALLACLQAERLPDGAVLRLGPHADGVKTVCWSPDGRAILTGGRDGTLTLWDAANGKKLRTFEGHSGGVTCAVFSADGKTLLSGSQDRTLALWDVATATRVRSFEGHAGWVKDAAFRPGGKSAVSVSLDGKLIEWDVESGKAKRTVELAPRDVMTIGLTPDGRRALVGVMDFLLGVWDVEKGEKVHSLQGHTGWILAAGGSADGRQALSGSWDKTLLLWDLEKGEPAGGFPGHSSWTMAIAFSPDGRLAASGGRDHSVAIWDVAKRGVVAPRLVGHAGQVYGVAFSPGGRRVASASEDGTALVWNPAAKQAEQAAAWAKEWRAKAEADRRKELTALLPALVVIDWAGHVPGRERLLLTGDEGARVLAEEFAGQGVKVADDAGLKQLLADLDSDEFATRVKAQRELKAQGRLILSWVEEKLKDAGLNAEVRGALTDIRMQLRAGDPTFDQLARLRAVQVLLEMARSEAVTEALGRFAEGPKEDPGAEAARRALGR